MREAFRTNKSRLFNAVSGKNLQLALVFIFRKAGRTNVRQIRYTSIEKDLKDVMSKIISMVTRLQ